MVSGLNAKEDIMIYANQSRKIGKVSTELLYKDICIDLYKKHIAAAAKNNTDSKDQTSKKIK